MVYSSIPPIYLDPPNWQHHHQHQQQPNQSHDQNPPQHDHLLIPPPAGPAPQVAGSSSGGGGSGAGSIRPGSMTDRARLAKLPQPEQALKCPRCDSANTKFCYFNNYSLSQPRHFCKTCRRYWTRGGALRNVPVGGGCRRNKRSSKSSSSSTTNNNSSSKSTATTATSSSSQLPPISNTSNSTDHLNCHMNPQLSSQLSPFMASLHHFNTDHHYGTTADHLGLNFNQQAVTGTNGSGEFHQMGLNNNLGVGGGVDPQWRFQQMQQFPFMGNLESSPLGLYHPFRHHHQGIEVAVGAGGDKQQQASGSSSSSLASQFASVKMEESNQQAAAGLNLSRQLLSNINQQQQQQQQHQGMSNIDHSHHQYWSSSTNNTTGNNAWTDLSAGGFNSSSTSHLL